VTKYRNLYSFLLLLFFSGLAFSQELYFVKYTKLPDLPTPECYNIRQDADGLMWIGSSAGLFSFDGDSINMITNPVGKKNEPCYGVTPYGPAKFIVSSFNNSFFICDRKNARVSRANFNRSLNRKVPNKLTQVYTSVMVNDSEMYSSAQYSTYFINVRSGAVSQALTSDTLSDFYFRYEGDKFFQIKRDPVAPIFLGVKKNGHLRLCILKNGQTFRFKIPVKKDYIPSWRCYAVIDRNGEGIISMDQLLIKHKKDNSISIADGGGNTITLYIDNENNLWTGALNGGTKCYLNADITSHPRVGLGEYSVTGICQDYEGAIWCTTLEKGLFYCRNKSALHYPKIRDLTHQTFAIRQYENAIYYASLKNRLLVIRPDTVIIHEMPELNAKINRMVKCGNYFYMATSKSIFRTDANFKKLELVKRKGAPYSIAARFLMSYNSDTIVASLGTQVSIVHQNIVEEIYQPKFPIIYSAVGWDNKIICADKESLYELSLNGKTKKIYDLDGDVTKIKRMGDTAMYLFTEDSLILLKKDGSQNMSKAWQFRNVRILDIYNDGKGFSWCSTSNGVYRMRFTGDKIEKRRLSVADGMLVDKVQNIFEMDSLLYFNSEEGLFTFQDNIRDSLPEAKYQFASLKVNGREVKLSDTLLKLKYNANNLIFNFSLPSYNGVGEGAKLQYNISELGSEWKTVEGKDLRFDNLAPGSYSFRIRTVNSRNVVGHAVTFIKVKITRPFWFQWWFISICILLFLSLSFLIIKQQVEKIRKREEEKTLLNKKIGEYQLNALRAQMNPHFIFNALNSIQHYILNKDTQYAYDYLAKFGKLIRQVLVNSEQSNLPLKKEIETLKLYVELEQKRFKNRFEVEYFIDEEIEQSSISVPTMLVQPYVENAIWHGIMNLPEAKRGKLIIKFLLEESKLKIIIEDNGIGRELAALKKIDNEYKSVGMLYSEQRLNLLQTITQKETKIIITDLYNVGRDPTGTRVELQFELDQ
jgi:ligand-binding sensor domain-containing protein